jgi:hypothetical protein
MKSTQDKSDAQAEERFKQRLIELGLLSEITPPLAPEDYPQNRQPGQVKGNALSELLIRERR